MGKSYNKDNQHAIKHGGAAATQAIAEGTPFTGLAAAEQERVMLQLAEIGSLGIETDIMTRLVTCTNLYWNAVIKAAESGDINSLDRYVSRFGWLAQASMRALKQTVDHEKERGSDPIDAQVILDTYRKEGDKDA